MATIRLATEADIDGLVASHTGLSAAETTRDPIRNPNWARDHGAEHTRTNLAHPDRLVLAAEADGKIIGHLLGGYFPPSDMWTESRAYLISMHVHTEWRGNGIGTQLVARFKEWAHEREAVQLRVTAYATNDGAIRFYRRHGFAPLEITFAAPA
jgi:GNAT superfamily N-acetyltransferase